jgi:hypothetical protein
VSEPSRPDQQRANEERVPGQFGVDAYLDPVILVGAAIEVLREQGLAAAMREKVGVEIVEIIFRHFAIAVPPHAVAREIIDNGVLVLGRAAGVMSGLRAERAAGNNLRLAIAHGTFVERRFRQIPMNGRKPLQTEFVCSIGLVPYAGLLHGSPPETRRAMRTTFVRISPECRL